MFKTRSGLSQKTCERGECSRKKVLISSGWKFEIINSMIAKENNLLNVTMLCDIAGVSRSGYYNWVKSEIKRDEREEKDRSDFELVLKAYNQRGYNKGARGIYMTMLHWEEPIIMNLKKIRRLMKKYNLICPIRKANPYRRMAKAIKTNNVSDNILNREFTMHGARRVLLTDITYLSYKNKFCYLSTILDAFTKEVLGYVVSDSLELDFVLETVNKVIKEHGVALTTETLIHSDQGCHYTSTNFRMLVKDRGLRQSMSRRANCWDNAPQESFFGHLKDEIDISECESFREVRAIIDDWMDYYNNERYQWQLAKLAPKQYYEYLQTGVL
ncbi:MAG: IS3 family transposase [Cellulosilyticaceae bacterium]